MHGFFIYLFFILLIKKKVLPIEHCVIFSFRIMIRFEAEHKSYSPCTAFHAVFLTRNRIRHLIRWIHGYS